MSPTRASSFSAPLLALLSLLPVATTACGSSSPPAYSADDAATSDAGATGVADANGADATNDAGGTPADGGATTSEDATAPDATGGGDAGPADASLAGDTGADGSPLGANDAGADASSPDASGGGGADSGSVTAIYAAPSGTGGSCTFAAPCSLIGAQAAVRAQVATMANDIVVSLRGGTYRLATALTFLPGDSGQNGHTVRYEAYAGEVPVLSGAAQVTGFSQYDATKNIWRAPIPAAAAGASGRQLFVNGVRAVRARSAGSPSGVATTATGFTTTDATYASFANASRIEVVQDNDWKHMRCPLQSVGSVSGGSSLTVLPSCWAGNNTNVPNVSFPLNGGGLPAMSGISWVENAYELLTQAGQFYVDTAGGYVDYIPRTGEDLSTADVELPFLETLVSLAGTPGHLAPQNDDDPAITYAGAWGAYSSRGYGDLDDDVHAATATTASATIAFTGSGLSILGETNTDEGAFSVYVDGVQDTTQGYSQAASSRLSQQVIYSVLGLSSAAHTVKVVNASGTQFTVIDGFVVVPTAIAPIHDIAFAGITFAYATWNLPSTTGYIDNQAGVLWSTSGPKPTAIRIPAAVQVHRGVNVAFTGSTFTHLGGTAVDLADGTQGSSVTGCTIADVSGGGVSIGEVDDYFQTQPLLMTSSDTISDDAIANVGADYHDAVGIWGGYTRSATIAHNDIGHTPYSGMSLGWGWGWASPCSMQSAQGLASCRMGTIYAGGNQILANYIHDVMGYLHDGGPIYTNGGQGDGNGSATSVLANNFVTAGNGTNNMLYQDEGSSYWDTHDNVTSLGGSDWIGMWTPTIHDITVGPVNYTDNASTLNNGTNITFTAPTLVSGGNWPTAAVAIMTAAGLEPAYRAAATGATRDDDDQSLTFAGSWTAQGFRGLGDYDDNVHYTSTNGDAVTFTFTGTSVAFIGEKNSDQGEVAWSLDGNAEGQVDTSVPSGTPRLSQQVLFSSAVLASGTHVVQVTKSSGSYMTVDAFFVTP